MIVLERRRERVIVNLTNSGTISNATLGKLYRRDGANTGFSDRLELN